MVAKKHKNGVRELLNVDKLKRGEYSHATRVEGGYKIKANGKGNEIFVSDADIAKAAKAGHLQGQKVLSDVDVAGYTRRNGQRTIGDNVGDDEFMDTVAHAINENYGHEVAIHGHLYNGLNKPDVVKKLSADPSRIQGLLDEYIYLFDKRGYIGKMRYEDYQAMVRNNGSFRSRYADGTLVVGRQQPARISGPDPNAAGPHTVLRWDQNNNRIYQGREYDADGYPVRDVDFTNPTYQSGRPRPNHVGPPHQHNWIVNDPRVGPRSGMRRDKTTRRVVYPE